MGLNSNRNKQNIPKAPKWVNTTYGGKVLLELFAQKTNVSQADKFVHGYI